MKRLVDYFKNNQPHLSEDEEERHLEVQLILYKLILAMVIAMWFLSLALMKVGVI